MNLRRCTLVATLAAIAVCSLTGLLVAQTGTESGQPLLPPTKLSGKDSSVIPRAALLTERGRQLAEELRMLKRSRATMGSKHPTLPIVNKKIDDIVEQLKAWEPAATGNADNPFRPQDASPQLNENDLRELVLRLSKRVEQLEQRISVLEKR